MRVMKRKRNGWMMLLLASWLIVWTEVAVAQASGTLELRIRLRASDGTAVIGETVILERLPDEEPIAPDCVTNNNGECTWLVGRGLYQVLFTRQLDTVSALAVAEGGLRGFGVTVGDSPITYHFTFHSDGRVYFDAAPEAAVPSPIIPVGETLHGGAAPTPVPTSEQRIDVTPTRLPEQADVEKSNANPTSSGAWRLILFIGGGLMIGGGLHLWSRKRQTKNRQSSIQNRQSEDADA